MFLSVVCFAILIIHFMHLFVKNLLCLVLYYLLGHIYWIILFYPFDPICCVILEYSLHDSLLVCALCFLMSMFYGLICGGCIF